MDNKLEIILSAKDITGKAFTKVQAQVSNLTESIFSLNGVMVTLAGVSGMGLIVKSSLEATAAIEKNATMAGVGVKAYQELEFVASQHQITVDSLTDGLKELSLRTDEYVKTGAGPSKEAFERLNYTQAELNEKLADTPALLQDIIGRMDGLGQAAKIRIADELFGGTGGEQFVAMINAGAKSFGDFRKEASRVGAVMDASVIKRSVLAKKEIDKLTKVLSTQFQSTIAGLAPDIVDISTAMTDWVQANQGFIAQDLPGYIGNVAGSVKSFVSSKEFQTFFEVMTLGSPFAGGGGKVGIFGALNEISDAMRPDTKEGQLLGRKKQIEHILEMESNINAMSPDGSESPEIKRLKQELRNIDLELSVLKRLPHLNAVSNQLKAPQSGDSTPGNGGNPYPVTVKGKHTADDLANDPSAYDSISNEDLKQASQALNEYHRKTMEELKAVNAEFEEDFLQTTLSSYDYERHQLDQRYGYYDQHVKDKVKLEEWHAVMIKDINDRETAETNARVQEDLENILDQLDEFEDGTITFTESLQDAVKGWSGEFSNALTDMVWEADASFGDIAESFGKMLTEMIIQKYAAEPLMKFASWGIGQLLPFSASATGNVFDSSGIQAYAQGGTFTNTIVDQPTLFAHGGGFGLMGEAGPEAILPLTRTSNGDLGVQAAGSSPVEINIIDQRSGDSPAVETTTSQGPDGRQQINITIKKAVQAMMSDGSMDKTMRSNYGVSRAVVRR